VRPVFNFLGLLVGMMVGVIGGEALKASHL
jgi:hypothetical protein